VAKVVAKASA